MKNHDLVLPEIRQFEKIIDDYYLSNQLTKENFAYAAWFYSAFCEDFIVRDALNISNLNVHQLRYTTENHTEGLKYGFKWLNDRCPKNGNLVRRYNDDHYGYAINLYKLAFDYHIFSIILTYASRGLLHLRLDREKIICDKPLYSDWEYEAYNRLTPEKQSDKFDIQDFPIRPENIQFAIHEDRFSYSYGAKTISKLKEFFKELNKGRFELPEEWNLGKFKLKDFKAFYETIFSLCVLRFNARLWAENYWYSNFGKIGLGFVGSIIVLDKNELIKQLVIYSDLDEKIVLSIFDYLTYGSNNIRNTEPAIQPFIELNNHQIAIIPSLIISYAAERNLIVLLNKLPDERQIYLSLVDEKEDLMIQKLSGEIDHLSIRFENKIQLNKYLPDIDCALIDDTNKICCIIEFKWFIEPSEVRELIEKSTELNRGIDQLLLLKNDSNANQIVIEKLKIHFSYKLNYLLVSANWIGNADVQHADMPIISEKIFLKKIKASNNLIETIDWLNSRSYLPKEGTHFEIEEIDSKIGKWSFNWYAINPLISDVFDPI